MGLLFCRFWDAYVAGRANTCVDCLRDGFVNGPPRNCLEGPLMLTTRFGLQDWRLDLNKATA